MNEDTRLSTLHDHYKETFGSIRERERERDRLFVYIVVLFALLALQVAYPAEFGGVVRSVSVPGANLKVGVLPAAALLSATWVLIAVVALRYCQRVVWVERQYDYLHSLEQRLAELLGETGVFRREGGAYLEGSPIFQDWAWLLYVVAFPLIAIYAIGALVFLEWFRLDYPTAHLVLDSVTGAMLLGTFYLYRLHPPSVIASRLRSVF